MNPHVIRENIRQHRGERVMVKVFGMRNKNDKFLGEIKDIYSQIFTVNTLNGLKSFSYSEIINGEVTLTFV